MKKSQKKPPTEQVGGFLHKKERQKSKKRLIFF